MPGINQEIGARMKGIRELNDMSVQDLAQRIHIAPALLMDYERGETDIPVSALHDISEVLHISTTELMTGDRAKLSVYTVVRKNKGDVVDRRKAYDYKALANNFANRKMDPFLITIEPKPADQPISLNTHGGQEFHYCLEGSFEIQIGKHTVTIEAGDAIYFDSTCPHGMRALNGQPSRELVIIV